MNISIETTTNSLKLVEIRLSATKTTATVVTTKSERMQFT